MTVCAGCGDPVRWYPNSKSGKTAPLDPTPRPDGNVVLERLPGRTVKWVYRVLSNAEKAEPATGHRYALHFATCRKAEAYRRRDQRAHRAP